jgi:hypothetical protein
VGGNGGVEGVVRAASTERGRGPRSDRASGSAVRWSGRTRGGRRE